MIRMEIPRFAVVQVRDRKAGTCPEAQLDRPNHHGIVLILGHSREDEVLAPVEGVAYVLLSLRGRVADGAECFQLFCLMLFIFRLSGC